jgi:hypothetical protein
MSRKMAETLVDEPETANLGISSSHLFQTLCLN